MATEIYVGDCRDVMATVLCEKSVQTCITSPPYFGLRDYGHAGQIGLEQTPEAYVAQLVQVFREVRRVLRDDGTLWLNLGDSYVAGTTSSVGSKVSLGGGTANQAAALNRPSKTGFGLATKQLIGIPWRVAFALQADGWYLRQDIIWHKPNPMPESVTDRCTKAHEYLFMLTKSAKYYFDNAAMQEPAAWPTGPRNTKPVKGAGVDDHFRTRGELHAVGPRDTRNRRSVWTVTTKPFKGAHFATFPPDLIEPCVLAGSKPGDTVLDPFGGAGTTALVAEKHGRNAILCELNPEYADMSRARLAA